MQLPPCRSASPLQMSKLLCTLPMILSLLAPALVHPVVLVLLPLDLVAHLSLTTQKKTMEKPRKQQGTHKYLTWNNKETLRKAMYYLMKNNRNIIDQPRNIK